MKLVDFSRAGSLLAGLLLSVASSTASADIVLGHSGDLSGNTAALTTDYVRGMNAYFDDLNKRGGIRGEKIKLISLDDGFNPDKTAENTKALIEKHEAVALVGFRGTANMLKIVPIVQAAGIAQIGNTSGAKSLRDPYVPNLFHVRASTTDEVEAAVNHAWTIGINKIAALYQDDAFGKEGLEALNASLQKRGAKPVAVAPVPRGTVDVSKAIDVIAAAQPQAVLLIGQAKPNAAFIKGLRLKGVSPQFFVLSVSSGLYAELKEPSAGVIAVQVVPYPFTELGNAVVREYQTVISASGDKKFSYNSMEGFLNAKLVARAMQKISGPVSRAKIISTLESFTNEDLGGFALTYGKHSNLGSRFVNLTMIRADGSFAR
ncbi:ABC-type branched-chain amino acid transport system, substrate-binding protein [Polaromonas sp. OV174]|uniref:ABC transporter substrate-binding protein n=1 Tax=Polaromonas sp. OV174 TaxID=1855300 RepID=UPI0008F3979A|nr:ABC transporter substrate-binding protein [Polaromonas sp. OV174]SFB94889.1 ABC-type branched-chain amino acid transport system, substrate-binding protein [Polaromonas sp. OV174]